MSDAPLIIAPTLPVIPFPPPDAADRLVAAFLAGRSPQTLRAYRTDLADFAGFSKAARIAEAADGFWPVGMGVRMKRFCSFGVSSKPEGWHRRRLTAGWQHCGPW